MQEQSVMELVKWFIGGFLVLGLVSITLFCFQFLDVNSYKQQVNYEIERNGGLTTKAVNSLKEYSNKYYNGRFQVHSDLLHEKVEFGDIVDYKVKATFKIPIFPLPDVNHEFDGCATSQVR